MIQRLAHVIAGNVDKTVAFANLPPVLRVLLLTDGTVTHSLAAYFNEAIEVRCLQQGRAQASAAVFGQSGPPQDVIEREVMLTGEESGREYAHAFSTICLQGLDADMQQQLAAGEAGIGELLSARNLETFREITRIYVCDYDVDRPVPFAVPAPVVLARDYTIHSHGRAVIRVTEEFPVDAYEAH